MENTGFNAAAYESTRQFCIRQSRIDSLLVNYREWKIAGEKFPDRLQNRFIELTGETVEGYLRRLASY